MANDGIAPPDFNTSVGKVRVLLGDTDPTDVAGGFGTYMFFSDDELTALLDMYDDSPKLTAARCMETIAGSQALLLKAWSSDDLTVNGDRIAKELRELAKQLRAEAIAEESSDAFNVIPFPVTELETWWN
jgi:2-polyprenyl-6-methoxyphenol hydroxylase-like FAD-dependent oxidoreductase